MALLSIKSPYIIRNREREKDREMYREKDRVIGMKAKDRERQGNIFRELIRDRYK